MAASSELWVVLSHYGWQLPPQRRGWQSIRCFIHEDTHASCRVNADIGKIKCLACDFHGNVYDVVHHYEGLNFRDSKRRVEEITGSSGTRVPLPGQSSLHLSGGSRRDKGNSKYVPPRLRGRT